jgi:hypothetical protein
MAYVTLFVLLKWYGLDTSSAYVAQIVRLKWYGFDSFYRLRGIDPTQRTETLRPEAKQLSWRRAFPAWDGSNALQTARGTYLPPTAYPVFLLSEPKPGSQRGNSSVARGLFRRIRIPLLQASKPLAKPLEDSFFQGHLHTSPSFDILWFPTVANN